MCDQTEEKQEEEFKLPKGSVLKLTGLGREITREDIKEVRFLLILTYVRQKREGIHIVHF